MKKMTKFFALALLAGAMVSCSTEDTASTTPNGKVAVQFTGGISVNTRASETTWENGDRIGITDIDNDTQYGNVPFILKQRGSRWQAGSAAPWHRSWLQECLPPRCTDSRRGKYGPLYLRYR